jgi:hypothetical protein
MAHLPLPDRWTLEGIRTIDRRPRGGLAHTDLVIAKAIELPDAGNPIAVVLRCLRSSVASSDMEKFHSANCIDYRAAESWEPLRVWAILSTSRTPYPRARS